MVFNTNRRVNPGFKGRRLNKGPVIRTRKLNVRFALIKSAPLKRRRVNKRYNISLIKKEVQEQKTNNAEKLDQQMDKYWFDGGKGPDPKLTKLNRQMAKYWEKKNKEIAEEAAAVPEVPQQPPTQK